MPHATSALRHNPGLHGSMRLVMLTTRADLAQPLSHSWRGWDKRDRIVEVSPYENEP